MSRSAAAPAAPAAAAPPRRRRRFAGVSGVSGQITRTHTHKHTHTHTQPDLTTQQGEYLKHEYIEGAQGIKIVASGVEKAVAGTTLMRLEPEDYPEHIKGEVMTQLDAVNSVLQKEGRGVFVQASTLGSLEALLEFLRTLKPPIPVAGFNIGPVNKKDIINASIMLEHKREYATILAFDVKVTAEAAQHAKELGVRIFTADIIYHLFDAFTAYMDEINGSRRQAAKSKAVFPCVLEILPQHIFNKKDPIVMGVLVKRGPQERRRTWGFSDGVGCVRRRRPCPRSRLTWTLA